MAISAIQQRVLEIAAQAEAEHVDPALRLQEVLEGEESPLTVKECSALIARARRARRVELVKVNA